MQKQRETKGAKHRLYKLGPGPNRFRKGPTRGQAKGNNSQSEFLAKPMENAKGLLGENRDSEICRKTSQKNWIEKVSKTYLLQKEYEINPIKLIERITLAERGLSKKGSQTAVFSSFYELCSGQSEFLAEPNGHQSFAS